MLTRILVDADAAPKSVLAICREAARKFSLPVITVANFNHRITSPQHIMVGDTPQAVDMEIIKLTRKGDVVVTQDWGLAALVLGKGAAALSPAGYIFHPSTIDFLLEERAIKAKYRRRGGRTKGPAKRTPADDRHFSHSLNRLLAERPT